MARRAIGVLWAYCTTVWKATKETLFFMAYETEVVIPIQVTTMPKLHTEERITLENAGILKTDLSARVRLATYQQQIRL